MPTATRKYLKRIGKTGGSNGNGKDKENPARVAKEVIKQIKSKKLVSVRDAMLKVGYSERTANSKTSEIRKRPEYMRVLNNFLESLKEKRAMSLANINEKKLKKSSARDLAQITDVLSKNVNLIEGKPTSIEAGIGQFLIKLEQASKDKGKTDSV